VSSAFGHRLNLDGPVLNFWKEKMRISFSTQRQSLWRAGIIFVLWVVWLLYDHATFQGRRAIFAGAFALTCRFIREMDSLHIGTM